MSRQVDKNCGAAARHLHSPAELQAQPQPQPQPQLCSIMFVPQRQESGIISRLLSDEEMEAVIENFAKEDDASAKTWTRRFVETFLAKFKNAPSLSKAYAYYEHITLPRHFVGEHAAEHVMRRAEPGELKEKTELYPLATTRSSSLIEWGIGVDLYFSTLRVMAVILLVAGLLHLPNARFYASDEYSPEVSKTSSENNLPFVLQGTAVCLSEVWVACVNSDVEHCPPGPWDGEGTRDRYGVADDGTVLVLRDVCDGGNYSHGFVNWVVLMFLLVTMFLTSMYLRSREIRFDEDKLTATDYSLVVKNPPPDAVDPEEWKDYFEQFTGEDGGVTAVTVALNNEQMVRRLIYRRIHRNNLRLKLPKGVDLDDENVVRNAVAQFVKERDAEPRGILHKLLDCTLLPILRVFGMFLKAETLVDRVFKLEKEIKELQETRFEAVQIFVTFETEEGQRAALTALSMSRLDIMMNNTSKIPPSAIFRDRVLKVGDCCEPDSVRWLDLSTKTTNRVMWRLINVFLTLVMVAGAGTLVTFARYNATLQSISAVLVSIFNSTIPVVVKLLMMFERHHSEGSYQTSLYLKITIFRWINTALLTKLLTPFPNTLQFGKRNVLQQITAIMWSELWLTPGLRLLDLFGNIKKHVMAPRAHNQEQMNSWFQGTKYNLGERYTDLTKVLFVCFFYSSLMPVIFFFGAAILIIQYYLGNELAKFSRRYFFSGAVLAYAIISAYTWAQFPYDNICDPLLRFEGAAGEYQNVKFLDGTTSATPITVTQNTYVEFCSQRWNNFRGFVFPPTPRVEPVDKEWMTPEQATLAAVYGWTAFALLIGFIIIFFGTTLRDFFLSWFTGVYTPHGQDQKIDFSANSEISAYVPQIRQSGFPFPFLACDIDEIDQGLIGWNDPNKSYDHYNLMFDIPFKGMRRKHIITSNTRTTTRISSQHEFRISSTRDLNTERGENGSSQRRPIFSVIKHYPPAWAQKARDSIDEHKEEEIE